MKRLLGIFLVTAMLCGCAASDGRSSQIPEPTLTPEELVGKTLEEVSDVLKWDRELLAYGHGFATDNVGNPVCYTWELNGNDDFVITGAEIFPAKDTDNSPERFEELEEGMTISEVVAMLGVPSDIPATGVFYIAFTDSQGTPHWLAWGGDPLTLKWSQIPEHAQ